MPEITMNMPKLPTYNGRQMEWTGERRIPANGECYASIYYDGVVIISREWGHEREEWIVRRKRWKPEIGEDYWFVTDCLTVDHLQDFIPRKGLDINIWRDRDAAENARDAVVRLLESLDPETGLPWADPSDPSDQSDQSELPKGGI
jgi:hypothetical protein